jgi:NitT/TauT family transport system substrate-binding protein
MPSLARPRQRTKLKMVAVNYEKAPCTIFSLSTGANVTQVKQLKASPRQRHEVSPREGHQRFMTQNGLDPNKLTIINVAPPARASALLFRTSPGDRIFVMAKPGLEAAAKAKGAELHLLLADHGLKLYSVALSPPTTIV